MTRDEFWEKWMPYDYGGARPASEYAETRHRFMQDLASLPVPRGLVRACEAAERLIAASGKIDFDGKVLPLLRREMAKATKGKRVKPPAPTDTEILDWLERQYPDCHFRFWWCNFTKSRNLIVERPHTVLGPRGERDKSTHLTLRGAIKAGMAEEAKETNAKSPSH